MWCRFFAVWATGQKIGNCRFEILCRHRDTDIHYHALHNLSCRRRRPNLMEISSVALLSIVCVDERTWFCTRLRFVRKGHSEDSCFLFTCACAVCSCVEEERILRYSTCVLNVGCRWRLFVSFKIRFYFLVKKEHYSFTKYHIYTN